MHKHQANCNCSSCAKHRGIIPKKILPAIRYDKPITPRTKIVTGNKIIEEREGKEQIPVEG